MAPGKMMRAQGKPYVEVYAPYTKGFGTNYVDTERDAQRFWDFFYKDNTTHFFKDRHWIPREFPEMFEAGDAAVSILEVGCGVGNTVYPVREVLPQSTVYCFDFSPTAIRLVKEHAAYDPARVIAFQHDLTADAIPDQVPDEGIDFATMIFVLSAIPEPKHLACLQVMARKMRRGGLLYFRDYAVDDLAQRRFRNASRIDENTFRRGDGTRTYFFAQDHMQRLADDGGFEVVLNEYVKKTVTNVKEKKEMERLWIQAKLRKK
uniref:tRNA N(3)-methylcytidine methyltransferase n=1 Tax=Eutreptiella gymnastica TaxID=73025 RepID=A0A7S4GK47_9EUGL